MFHHTHYERDWFVLYVNNLVQTLPKEHFSLFIDGFEAFLNKFKKNVWGGQVLLNFYESFLCNVKDKDIMTVLWIVSGPMNKTMFDSAL